MSDRPDSGDGRVRIEPRCPGGCHTGMAADFDHYCDAAGVRPGEEGPAFAAWLNALTGWDGEARRVDTGADHPDPGDEWRA